MMKHKQYNVHVRHSPNALQHDMELRRDLAGEIVRTVESLKSIRDIAIHFKSLTPSWSNLRELEVMNERLKDIITEWGPDQ